MADIYDFKTINTEVPIEEVLAYFGIEPVLKGSSRGWYSLRSGEKDPSAHIDKDKRFGNTIHDFGDGNTFNPISLTAYLAGVDAKEASRILGEHFGIEPIQRDNEKPDPNIITDWEWRLINIYPDMASKNMDLNPGKYGVDRTQAFADKYKMSMSELKKSDDDSEKRMYERIVRSKGIAHVLEMRNEYYKTINSEISFTKAVSKSLDDAEILEASFDMFDKLAKELAKADAVLIKAIKDTSIKYKANRYNVKADFYKVLNGEVSFEIGNDSHYSIKSAAFQEKTKVFYCLVNLEEYNKLMENGLDNMRFAAFQKGDQVNLAFVSSDSSRFKFLINALRGKETDLNKTVNENDLDIQYDGREDIVIREGNNNLAKNKPIDLPSDNKTDVGIDIS